MLLRSASCLFLIVLSADLQHAQNVFQDASSGAGLNVVLRNGASGEKHLIETMVGGVAVFDIDNDGRLDLYFTNGASQPSLSKPDETFQNRLFRNVGRNKFQDVTATSNVKGEAFHFGVAAADYDNDGWTDLFVTGMPRSILYRNRGDGSFEDVTQKSGVENRRQWPVSAGWFDYDNDGLLDLFVVNYVQWNPATEPYCGDTLTRKYRTYCHPKHYQPLPNTLFRNNGNGAFTDVSESTGLSKYPGKGMAVAFSDFDNDGDMDIAVANDTMPDFLFRNDRGKLTEIGVSAGIAFNDDGRALSSMGMDFRDVDNDGKDDLFVTALANETFPLYRNTGTGQFTDVTYPSGIGKSTMGLSGWGNAILDFDNDGRKDLFAAAGDVQDNSEVFSSLPSKQSNLLLLNAPSGFRRVSAGAPAIHRGAAFGDFDGDGAVDVVLSRLADKPLLLRNALPPRNWIAFRLTGVKSNRDGIGARIRLVSAPGSQWNHMTSAVGYASSSHTPVHFGLGNQKQVEYVEIRWPSGITQRVNSSDLKLNSVMTIKEPAER